MSKSATIDAETLPEGVGYLVTEQGLDSMLNGPVIPDDLAAIGSDDVAPSMPDAEDKEAFWPDTREKIEWVLEKIMEARAEATKHRAFGAELAANAEAMARDAEREAEHLIFQFGAPIREFVQKDLESRKGRRPGRSVKFYHGLVGFETEPQKVTVLPGQDAAAVAWAKESHPDLLLEGVDKKALSKLVQLSGEGFPIDPETGEKLEWASVRPASDPYAPHTFYIKNNAPKKPATASTDEPAE